MDSKNIFCFVRTELEKPPEIHASRLEYPLKLAKVHPVYSFNISLFFYCLKNKASLTKVQSDGPIFHIADEDNSS